MKERGDFEKILADAVYETLSWIDSLAAHVLCIYLQDACMHTPEIGLRKSKLTIKDAKVLEKGLHKIFGFGAKVFERRILEILYAKLALDKEIEQNFKFSNEVKKARVLYKSKLHTRAG